MTWHVPDWISDLGTISPSPDAKSLAVGGINRSFDSVVVATVDIDTGRFTRVAIIAGSDPKKVIWLADGSMMLVFREPQGAFALYRIARGKPARRVGGLPHTEEELKTLLSQAVASGTIKKGNVRLLTSAFEFGELKVRQIMTPRTEMVYLLLDQPLQIHDLPLRREHQLFGLADIDERGCAALFADLRQAKRFLA